MHWSKWLKRQTSAKKSRQKSLHFSEEQIRAKAYEVWQERRERGESPQDDWQIAIQRLQQERSRRWQKPLQRVLSWLNQPLIWVEKRVMEPLADWFERAAIFKIVEKLSPVLEAVGVIAIPVVIWWFSQSYQAEKDGQERAMRQHEAIKTYLNQLTTVLLDGDVKKNPDLQKVTRASTLALLQDPNLTETGKKQVIIFLYEIGLISAETGTKARQAPQKSLISLSNANLSHIDLRFIDLSGINLHSSNLSFAQFNSSLRGATLKNADLRNAVFASVDLRDANLAGANLTGASLRSADLRNADLRNTKFHSPPGMYDPDARYRKYGLEGTDLGGANLQGSLITDEQLKRARLCQTTLPDGTKSDRDCAKKSSRDE
jgi:uncharacterized protein YjbI with pentapeptide repeats